MSDGQVVIDVQLGDKSKIQSDAKVINEILKVLGINAGDQMDKNFSKNADAVTKESKDTADKVKSNLEKPINQKINTDSKQAVNDAQTAHEKIVEETSKDAEQTIKTRDEATDKARGIIDKILHMKSFKDLTINAKDNASKTLRGMQRTADVTKKSFISMKDVIAGTMIGMAAVKALDFVKDKLKELIGLGAEYNKEQQVMLASWTTLAGSASKGQQMVDMINKLTVKTGQATNTTDELAQAFYHLHSNAKEAESMTHAMENMGDTVHLSGAQLTNVTNDMVHGLATGKMTLEMLNQVESYFPMMSEKMAEHFAGNKKLIAEQFKSMLDSGEITKKKYQNLMLEIKGAGSPTADASKAIFRQMVGAGGISAQEFIQQFEKLGNKTYGMAADNMMKTMWGMDRIIKARVPTLAGDFVGPFQEAQSGLFSGFSKYLQSKDTENSFKAMGQAASDGVTTIISAFGKVFGQKSLSNSMQLFTDNMTNGISKISSIIAGHAKDIVNFLSELKKGFSIFAKTGVSDLKTLGPVALDTFKEISHILDPFIKMIVAHPKLFADIAASAFILNKSMSLLAPPFSLASKGIAGTTKTLKYFRKEGTLGNKVTSNFAKGLGKLGKWTGDKVVSGIRGIGSAARTTGKFIGTMTSAVLEFGKTGVIWIAQKVKILAVAAAQKIAAAATKTWEIIQKGLNLAFKDNPIGLIVTAVGALVIGFIALYKHCKPFRDFINGLGEDIKKGFVGIGHWFAKQWDGAVSGVEKLGSKLHSRFESMKSTAVKLTGEMANQVMDKNSWLNKHTNGVFSDLFSGVKKTMKSGYNVLQDYTDTWGDILHGRWSKVGGDMKKMSSDMMKTAKAYFSTGYKSLNDLTNGWLNKTVSWFEKLPGRIANGVKKGWKSIESAFSNIGNGMVEGIDKGINGVVGGINWVLKKVDAPTIKPGKVPKFATGGKALGLSIVGEAGKNELIRHSDGQVEMSPNTATLYNFTDPVDILGGDATEALLGSMPKMFAKGTWLGSAMDFVKGGWNSIAKGAEGFWNEVTHPAKLLNTAVAKFTNLSGLSPNIAKMAEGTVKTVASDAVNWVKKQLMGSADNPSGSKIDRWKPVIERAAGMSGINLDGSGMSAIINRIKKESGGDPTVLQKVQDVNSRAGHPAIGLLQYIPSTFAAWARKGYTNIRSGLAQLLAMFNDSHWLRDISMPGGWGPTGAKRYAKGTTSLTNFFPKYANGTAAIQKTRFNYSMGHIGTSTYIKELESIEKRYKLTAAQHRSVLLSIHAAEKKMSSERESASKKAESAAKKRENEAKRRRQERETAAKKRETARQKSYRNQIENIETKYKTGKISRSKYVTDLKEIEKHHKLNSDLVRKISIDISNSQKQFTTAQNTLNKDIASAATTYANKVKSINTDLTNKIKSINSDLQNNIKTLQDQYNSDLSSKQNDIYGGIFDNNSGSVTYKQDLTHQMQESLHDLQAYQSDMASLSDKLPSSMMDELKAAGVGAESQIHAITTMTDAELRTYVDMWNQRHQISNDEAAKELQIEKDSTDAQIAAAQASAQAEIDAAKKSADKQLQDAKNTFVAKLKSLKSVKKAGMSLGKNTVKGIISGLKGQEGALNDELNKIAKSMTKVIKKTLKIHSPSQVMRDEVGANVGAGLVQGIDRSNDSVAAAAKRLAQSAVPDGLMNRISNFVSSAAQMMPAINIPTVSMAGGPAIYQGTTTTQTNNRPVQLTVVTQYDGKEVARTTQMPIDIMNQQRINVRQFMQGRNS
jgi:SLT domain-containing protein